MRNDLEINVLKGKQLTNIRAAGKDEAVRLTPPIRMTLEKALAYIEDDEWSKSRRNRFGFARPISIPTSASASAAARMPRSVEGGVSRAARPALSDVYRGSFSA